MQITDEKKQVEGIWPSYSNFLLNSTNLYIQYNFAIYDAGLSAIQSLYGFQEKSTDTKKISNLIRSSFDSSLRKTLEEEKFTITLSNFLESFSEMERITRHNQFHSFFDDMFAKWNLFIEPFRDTINRTPSEVIPLDGKFDLLHYHLSEPKYKTPVLMVGSLINRHYILDLLPKISVVRQFQKQGFDVYATDWRTPMSFDKDMTLNKYVLDHVEKAVEKIQKETGQKKISLYGYCWGGIFALIYSALHPENVKNLILHATPFDLENPPTPIEHWTQHLNADKLVDAFGNIPGIFLNLAFLMRNPIEAFLKYPRFFSDLRTWDEILQFVSIETWLYDSRPIIGHVFRQIVDDIYKKNKLAKNQMKIGEKLVDLKKINMPVLNIVGSGDDLVPPESSRNIISKVASSDSRLIEFPTGHVGLCISSKSHEKLWPEVVQWLSKRS